MRIDFKQTLHSINGVALALETNEDGTVETPATLGHVSTAAIMAPKMVDGQPQPATGPEALHALSLALRIFEATGPIDIAPEEAVYLRERIAEHWTLPIVVGRAWQMLEGA